MSRKPPVSMCGVFVLGDDSILVEGIDYEPSGPGGLVSNFRVRLSEDAAKVSQVLGSVVLSTLDFSTVVDGASHDHKSVLGKRTNFLGVKSNRAFESSSKYVLVSKAADRVTVTPCIYQENSGGWFKHLPEDAESCLATAEAVAEVLKRCFSRRSKGHP